MESGGHPPGVALGQLGPLAREQLVHGQLPQPQPALEVAPSQLDLGVQGGVGSKRATRVGLGTEQDRLPEGGDAGQVGLEVEVRHVREQEADHGVGERSGVELADQELTVLAGVDVVAGVGAVDRHRRFEG